MGDYKRFTQWTENGASLKLDNPQNDEQARKQLMEKFKLACNRLAELEDKIENGTLVELPRLLTYVDYCYGLEKYVVQWIDNGKIKSKTFWNEKKALKKLKELKEV